MTSSKYLSNKWDFDDITLIWESQRFLEIQYLCYTYNKMTVIHYYLIIWILTITLEEHTYSLSLILSFLKSQKIWIEFWVVLSELYQIPLWDMLKLVICLLTPNSCLYFLLKFSKKVCFLLEQILNLLWSKEVRSYLKNIQKFLDLKIDMISDLDSDHMCSNLS